MAGEMRRYAMKPALPSDGVSPAARQQLGTGWLAHAGARWAKLAATIFCVVFLAIQLATPVVQLIWAPRPARFGWQMFSVDVPPPSFTAVLDNGTTQPVALEPYVTSLRGDVPLAQFLPAHLCRVLPHVVAIRYQRSNQPQSETYRCST